MYPRLNNGNINGRRLSSAKMGKTRNNNTDDQNPDEEDDGENKRVTSTAVDDLGTGINRFYNWPSSRIVRVSRATGGKDRHSKVLTSKGLRDRRVRLSVNTAIQFYDLQDRLGYDQPSKAVEWLLKAAATSIDELPPINTLFPDTPKQLISYEKRSSTPDQLGAADPNAQKSSAACSSNSENSKGSGLSLSRSECRVKARERAKERVTEKDNPLSQATSFTELLNGGMSKHVIGNNPTNGGTTNDYFHKSLGHCSSSSPMDYFTSGLSRPAQMYFAVNPPASSPLFSVTGEHQHFSFVPDPLLAAGENNNSSNNNNGGSEYNLNFTISSSSGNNNSSGLAGFNRGTLQSNSSSFLPHLQRFPAIVDGSPPSFFIGTALPHVENHHQFLPGFDSQANIGRYSGHRGGKGKK